MNKTLHVKTILEVPNNEYICWQLSTLTEYYHTIVPLTRCHQGFICQFTLAFN